MALDVVALEAAAARGATTEEVKTLIHVQMHPQGCWQRAGRPGFDTCRICYPVVKAPVSDRPGVKRPPLCPRFRANRGSRVSTDYCECGWLRESHTR